MRTPTHLTRAALTRAALISAALTLSACTPTPLTTTTPPEQRSHHTPAADYHPHEPNTHLTYIDPSSNEHATIHTLTPTTINGAITQRHHHTSRTHDHTSYREATPSGILLHRIDTPTHTTTYNPPKLELPAAGRLEPGARWGGETTVREYRRTHEGEQLEREYRLVYLTSVTDAREIVVGGRPYPSFLLATERFAHVGDSIIRSDDQRWFVPYVGYAVTRQGWRLTLARFE